MTVKPCFKCGQEKPLSQFYKHKAMSDGYLNKCKECTKSDVMTHRLANIEQIRGYDRERGISDKRKERVRKKYRSLVSTEEGRAAFNAKSREGRGRYLEKISARSILRYAVLSGTILKKPCRNCASLEVEAHHDDYSKPLDIIWLCKFHHGERHRELNALKRKSIKLVADYGS